MTNTAERLAEIMNHLEAYESAIAVNNLIAQGLVTDPEVIREAAVANNALMGVAYAGILAWFSDNPEFDAMKAETIAILTQD